MYVLLSMCLAAQLTYCHRSEILDSEYDFISFTCLLGGLISCYTIGMQYASLMIPQLSICLDFSTLKLQIANVGNLLWISLHIR